MTLTDEQHLLERSRINLLLEKALENLVVFVTAGEGYGKTKAVNAFLKKRRENVIWLSISEQDNDPWHFWENVVQAVSAHEPRTGKFLEETGFPESQNQMNRYLNAMYNTVSNREKILVVADDCHLIHDERIVNFVTRLISFPHRRETSILISRTELNFNTMPLLSKGYLSQIGTEDLRFNEEEIFEFFRLKNIKLSREDSRKILADTEGWALAISLVAEEMKREKKSYSPFLLEEGSIRDMEEKLFSAIAPPLQRFLVVLSLFDQWPLEALLEIASSLSQKFPEHDFPDIKVFNSLLLNLSSFISYDSYLYGLKIHRVFLNYLIGKQDMLSREEVKTAYTARAEWCMKNRLWLDAANNYARAEDYEGLIQAIYSFPRLMPRSIASSFLDILDRIARENDLKGGVNSENRDFLFLRHVTRAGILLNLGLYRESENALKESIHHFESLPPGKNTALILSSCYEFLGTLSFLSFHMDRRRAIDFFNQAVKYHKINKEKFFLPIARQSIGSYVNLIAYPAKKGDFAVFIENIVKCLPYLSITISGCLTGIDNLCSAELAFFKADLEEAEQEARKAILKFRENEQFEAESKGLFYLLRTHLGNGDVQAFLDTWEQMETQLDKTEYVNRYIIHEIMSGWFYAHIGEAERVPSWLRSQYEESELNLLLVNYESIVKAKSLFLEKRYKEALKLLEQRAVREGLGSYHLGKLETTILEMIIHSRMGNNTDAIKALEAAYEMALVDSDAPLVLDMPFIEFGEDMRDFAKFAVNTESKVPRAWLESLRNRSSVYGKKIQKIIEQYRSSTEGAKIPFLRAQEISVLSGLSQGLSREEIAKTTSLSINTVKITIKTLYAKLGAFNRADAIRIANKVGII